MVGSSSVALAADKGMDAVIRGGHSNGGCGSEGVRGDTVWHPHPPETGGEGGGEL